MRISRWAVSVSTAVVLAVGAAAPAMAEEELQPLPPVRTTNSSNVLGSLSLGGGSSDACSKLNAQLAEVKAEWDAAVKAGDNNLANLLRIDYTNLAVSYYQCNLAKGSLI